MVHGWFSILIVIISIVSLLISYLLIKIATGYIKIPFVSSFFMLYYLVFIYIGCLLLNVFYFKYELATGFYDRLDLVLNIWLYSTAGLFLLPLGMLFANLITGYKPRMFTSRLLSKEIIIKGKDSSNFIFILFVGILIISVIALLLYRAKIGEFPIIKAFEGVSPIELAKFRSNATNNFPGKLYRYELFMKVIPSVILVAVYFLRKEKTKWRGLFYVLLFYMIFVNVMDLQKAPVIRLLLLLCLAYFYAKNKISKPFLIRIGIISLILLSFMYIYFMGMTNRGFSEILDSIFHRVFIGQSSTFSWYQKYQEHTGYLWGASFPNPGGILPFEHRRITVEVANFMHPNLAKEGIVGSMPSVFYADWFMNFGPLGALFSMIFWGFILQLFDIFFITKLSNNKTFFLSVLFIFFINYLSKYAGTSFVQIFFDEKIIFPFMLLISIIFLRQLIIYYSKPTNTKI